jgi:hypothetical protein
VFACVTLVGPRQCGKTYLLGELGEPWRRFDLERGADYDLISRDPDLFLRLHPDHVAIDEAQQLPALFERPKCLRSEGIRKSIFFTEVPRFDNTATTAFSAGYP